MAHFAAIEIREGEHIEGVLRHFISIAADLHIRFKTLEVYGVLEYGSTRFVRFRTDCPSYPAIVARLRVEDRGIIVPTWTGYCGFIRGRHGPVRGTIMQVTPAPGYGRVYHGSAVPQWATQFS